LLLVWFGCRFDLNGERGSPAAANYEIGPSLGNAELAIYSARRAGQYAWLSAEQGSTAPLSFRWSKIHASQSE
jgi:hypothetical protein